MSALRGLRTLVGVLFALGVSLSCATAAEPVRPPLPLHWLEAETAMVLYTRPSELWADAELRKAIEAVPIFSTFELLSGLGVPLDQVESILLEMPRGEIGRPAMYVTTVKAFDWEAHLARVNPIPLRERFQFRAAEDTYPRTAGSGYYIHAGRTLVWSNSNRMAGIIQRMQGKQEPTWAPQLRQTEIGQWGMLMNLQVMAPNFERLRNQPTQGPILKRLVPLTDEAHYLSIGANFVGPCKVTARATCTSAEGALRVRTMVETLLGEGIETLRTLPDNLEGDYGKHLELVRPVTNLGTDLAKACQVSVTDKQAVVQLETTVTGSAGLKILEPLINLRHGVPKPPPRPLPQN